jgi:hypothetical protein
MFETQTLVGGAGVSPITMTLFEWRGRNAREGDEKGQRAVGGLISEKNLRTISDY